MFCNIVKVMFRNIVKVMFHNIVKVMFRNRNSFCKRVWGQPEGMTVSGQKVSYRGQGQGHGQEVCEDRGQLLEIASSPGSTFIPLPYFLVSLAQRQSLRIRLVNSHDSLQSHSPK